VENDNYETQAEQDSANIELEEENDNDSRHSKSSNHQKTHNKTNFPQNSRKRKLLIDKLIKLARTTKIKTQNVQSSLFLTGEMCNDQLPEILKEYKIILQALHRARRK
jgi:hypothetical protein